MWYDIAYCISSWVLEVNWIDFHSKSKCRRIHSKSSTTSKTVQNKAMLRLRWSQNAAPLIPAPGNKKWCKDCSASASKSQVSMVLSPILSNFHIMKLIPNWLSTLRATFQSNSQLLSHSLTLALTPVALDVPCHEILNPPPLAQFRCTLPSNQCPIISTKFTNTLPPIIMEVENGALEDEFSLPGVHFPLPWLLEKEYIQIQTHREFACSVDSNMDWLLLKSFLVSS